jgi:hypothetical protein
METIDTTQIQSQIEKQPREKGTAKAKYMHADA